MNSTLLVQTQEIPDFAQIKTTDELLQDIDQG